MVNRVTFDLFFVTQDSADHYNDYYNNQDSYSGQTSPISFNDKSTPTPGNMSPYRVIPPIHSAEGEVCQNPLLNQIYLYVVTMISDRK